MFMFCSLAFLDLKVGHTMDLTLINVKSELSYLQPVRHRLIITAVMLGHYNTANSHYEIDPPQNLSQPFYLKGINMCFFILFECPAFTAVCWYRPH